MATSAPESAKTVTVACKLPSGLVLRLAQPVKVNEPVMGGGSREVTQYRPVGAAVTVLGTAHPQNAAPLCMIVAGYALTPDVDAKFWNEWLRQNVDHMVVKNNLIFAYEKDSDAKAAAKDNAERRSGLERLDPNKLPRGLKSVKAEKAEA